MELSKMLMQHYIAKEQIKKETGFILDKYFGSLQKLCNAHESGRDTEATEDYKKYISLIGDIMAINQEMVMIGMAINGFSEQEICKRMGFKHLNLRSII